MAKTKSKSARKAPPPPVKRRNLPWGMIAAVTVLVLFAAGVIGYAVKKNIDSKGDPAKNIAGIAIRAIPPNPQHVTTAVQYPESPPIGGDHDGVWADCTGSVYTSPIRNENAVHSLEHGAVWITYRPDLPADQLNILKQKVDGNQYTMLSPYPNLRSAVSLQQWGHQLFVDSATDPRIDEFLRILKQNPRTTPENGASCSNPDFKANPIAPGTAPQQ